MPHAASSHASSGSSYGGSQQHNSPQAHDDNDVTMHTDSATTFAPPPTGIPNTSHSGGDPSPSQPASPPGAATAAPGVAMGGGPVPTPSAPAGAHASAGAPPASAPPRSTPAGNGTPPRSAPARDPRTAPYGDPRTTPPRQRPGTPDQTSRPRPTPARADTPRTEQPRGNEPTPHQSQNQSPTPPPDKGPENHGPEQKPDTGPDSAKTPENGKPDTDQPAPDAPHQDAPQADGNKPDNHQPNDVKNDDAKTNDDATNNEHADKGDDGKSDHPQADHADTDGKDSPESDPNTDATSDADPKPDTDTDSDSDSDSDSKPDPDAHDAHSDSDTNPDSDAHSDSDSAPDSDSHPDPDADTDSAPDADADTDSDSTPDSDPDPNSDTDSDTDSDSDSDSDAHDDRPGLNDIRAGIQEAPGGLLPPDPSDQQALADAIPRNDDGTPQRFPDPSGNWAQLQNDGGPGVPGRSNNCADCSRSFLESWYGNPQVSAPRTPDLNADGTPDHWSPETDANENIINWTGAPHSYAGTSPDGHDAIAKDLLKAGPGSSAIVQVNWADGGGHAFNAVNHDGRIVWVDTQSGEVSEKPINTKGATDVFYIPLDADRNPLHPAQDPTADTGSSDDGHSTSDQSDNQHSDQQHDTAQQGDAQQGDAQHDNPQQDNAPHPDSQHPDSQPPEAQHPDSQQSPDAPQSDSEQSSPSSSDSSHSGPAQSDPPQAGPSNSNPPQSNPPQSDSPQPDSAHSTPSPSDSTHPDSPQSNSPQSNSPHSDVPSQTDHNTSDADASDPAKQPAGDTPQTSPGNDTNPSDGNANDTNPSDGNANDTNSGDGKQSTSLSSGPSAEGSAGGQPRPHGHDDSRPDAGGAPGRNPGDAPSREADSQSNDPNRSAPPRPDTTPPGTPGSRPDQTPAGNRPDQTPADGRPQQSSSTGNPKSPVPGGDTKRPAPDGAKPPAPDSRPKQPTPDAPAGKRKASLPPPTDGQPSGSGTGSSSGSGNGHKRPRTDPDHEGLAALKLDDSPSPSHHSDDDAMDVDQKPPYSDPHDRGESDTSEQEQKGDRTLDAEDEGAKEYGIPPDKLQNELRRDRDVHRVPLDNVHAHLDSWAKDGHLADALRSSTGDATPSSADAGKGPRAFTQSDLEQRLPGFKDLERGEQLAVVSSLARLSVGFHEQHGVGKNPENVDKPYRKKGEADPKPGTTDSAAKNSDESLGVRGHRKSSDKLLNTLKLDPIPSSLKNNSPDLTDRNYAVLEVEGPTPGGETHYVTDSSVPVGEKHVSGRHSEKHLAEWLKRVNQGDNTYTPKSVYTEREPCGMGQGHAKCSTVLREKALDGTKVYYSTTYRTDPADVAAKKKLDTEKTVEKKKVDKMTSAEVQQNIADRINARTDKSADRAAKEIAAAQNLGDADARKELKKIIDREYTKRKEASTTEEKHAMVREMDRHIEHLDKTWRKIQPSLM
ncbi:toxin glutamine deamidase domain-containing protein [Streptomyces angustmyceticus]|uniref:toxin glutamine deamidase domain-containing protein n=1 Tax=Streptomyces angustmyceticus TaxID=285578 RepID=UPI0037FB9142